jgi:hypothetical protein
MDVFSTELGIWLGFIKILGLRGVTPLPTCSLWMADANSHISSRFHAALYRGLEKLLLEWHGCGMAW